MRSSSLSATSSHCDNGLFFFWLSPLWSAGRALRGLHRQTLPISLSSASKTASASMAVPSFAASPEVQGAANA
jgi:hypothetical protein